MFASFGFSTRLNHSIVYILFKNNMSLQILNVALNHSVLAINSCHTFVALTPITSNSDDNSFRYALINDRHRSTPSLPSTVPSHIFLLDYYQRRGDELKLSGSEKLVKRTNRKRRRKRKNTTNNNNNYDNYNYNPYRDTTILPYPTCPTKPNGLDKYCCGDERVRYCCMLPPSYTITNAAGDSSLRSVPSAPLSRIHRKHHTMPLSKFKRSLLSSQSDFDLDDPESIEPIPGSFKQNTTAVATATTTIATSATSSTTTDTTSTTKHERGESQESFADKTHNNDSPSWSNFTQEGDRSAPSELNETTTAPATSGETSVNNFSDNTEIVSSAEILDSTFIENTNDKSNSDSNSNSNQQSTTTTTSDSIRIQPRTIIRLICISMMAAMFMTIITCFICKRYLKCKNSSCCCCCCCSYDPSDDEPSPTSFQHQVNGCYRGAISTSERRRDSYAPFCSYQPIFTSQRPPPLYSSGNSPQSGSLDEQLLVPSFTSHHHSNQAQPIEIGSLYILNSSNSSCSINQPTDQHHRHHHHPQCYSNMIVAPNNQVRAQSTGQYQQQQQQLTQYSTSTDSQSPYSITLDNLELSHLYNPVIGYDNDNNTNNSRSTMHNSPPHYTSNINTGTNISHQYSPASNINRYVCEVQTQPSTQTSSNSSSHQFSIISSSSLSKAKLLSVEDLLNLSKLTEVPIIIAASNEPPQVIMSKFNQLQHHNHQQNQYQTNASANVDEPRFCLLATRNLQTPAQPPPSLPAPPTQQSVINHSVEVVPNQLEPATNYAEPFANVAPQMVSVVAPVLDPPPPYMDITTTISTNNKLYQSLVSSTSDSGTDEVGVLHSQVTRLGLPPATSSDSGMASGDEASNGGRDCQGPDLDCSCITPPGETRKHDK